MDMFSMDFDAPELIQALDDFTKQILSQENQLSSGLEAAISSHSCPDAVEATLENSRVEGTRVAEEEETEMGEETIEENNNQQQQQQQVQIQPSTTDDMVTNKGHQNNLPLSEPVFEILPNMFDSYSPESNTSTTYIPEDNYYTHSKIDLNLDSILESTYPYDSAWDSPGSVESDILFPELA